MKRIFAIVLFVIMMVSCMSFFVACNKNSQVVELRILENGLAKKVGYLDYLLNAFNEKYKNENVKAVDAEQNEYSDLANDGPYGYGPDVLYQANDALMKYVDGQHILSIEVEKMDIFEQVPQNAWDAFKTTKDGKTVYCGVPVNVQQPVLFYRKDMLPDNWKTEWDKNKNDVPDMVEFWNEMYRYSKTIRQSDSKKFGFAMQLSNEYRNTGFLFSYGGYVFGNNNTNDRDIGLSKGNAKTGAKIIWDLAGIMDKQCIDNSFVVGGDSMIANGTIFATISTPDTINSFITAFANQYKKDKGVSAEEAQAYAEENFVVAGLPSLPKDGDITTQQDVTNASLWMAQKTMGGVNGYGISGYTKSREWALKFVEFATSKEMMLKRVEMLGLVPSRSDVLAEVENDVSKLVYNNLDNGTLVVMPSISSVKQIWSPIFTGFSRLATDGCGKRELTLDKIQEILQKIDTDIYNAIHTFS